VWWRFHVLSRGQVFVTCSVSAAILASPFAIVAAAHPRYGIFRDFFWPHQFDPVIPFVAAFLAIIPVLLSYYHLGRIGVVVSSVLAVVIFYVVVFAALYAFLLRPLPIAAGIFLSACVLLYVSTLALHNKACSARSIAEAKRSLKLTS
jgi:hypothetical protein